MTLDDVLNLLQVEPRHAREEPRGLIEILGVLAKDGDREGVTILDQDLAVAVEQDPTRRAQSERALMVVLRHLLVLLVLSDLQDPETHGECGKRHNHGDLEYDQSLADSPAIFTRRHVETAYRLLPNVTPRPSSCPPPFHHTRKRFHDRERNHADDGVAHCLACNRLPW